MHRSWSTCLWLSTDSVCFIIPRQMIACYAVDKLALQRNEYSERLTFAVMWSCQYFRDARHSPAPCNTTRLHILCALWYFSARNNEHNERQVKFWTSQRSLRYCTYVNLPSCSVGFNLLLSAYKSPEAEDSASKVNKNSTLHIPTSLNYEMPIDTGRETLAWIVVSLLDKKLSSLFVDLP